MKGEVREIFNRAGSDVFNLHISPINDYADSISAEIVIRDKSMVVELTKIGCY